MSSININILLSNFSKHIFLTAEEIEFLTPLLKSKSLTTAEFLLREGEICKYVSFVTKGCVKTYYQDENGFEHIIDFSIEEWWADDLYSYLTQTPSRYSIKAIEPTNVLQKSANPIWSCSIKRSQSSSGSSAFYFKMHTLPKESK